MGKQNNSSKMIEWLELNEMNWKEWIVMFAISIQIIPIKLILFPLWWCLSFWEWRESVQSSSSNDKPTQDTFRLSPLNRIVKRTPSCPCELPSSARSHSSRIFPGSKGHSSLNCLVQQTHHICSPRAEPRRLCSWWLVYLRCAVRNQSNYEIIIQRMNLTYIHHIYKMKKRIIWIRFDRFLIKTPYNQR